MKILIRIVFFYLFLGCTYAQTSLPVSQNHYCNNNIKRGCIGIETDSNGNKYIGFFADGKRWGQGIEYSSNGIIVRQGLWSNGFFTRSIDLNTVLFPFDLSSPTVVASSQSVATSPVAELAYSTVISDRAGRVKKIQEAVQARDFLTARELLKPLIDIRDSWALITQAQMHIRGDGGPKDLTSAFSLAKQLAERGYPPGQAMLARFYIWGMGVNKDVPEGIRLAKMAAEKNERTALNLLGILHFEGTGVKQDYSEMRIFWEKAAALGSNAAEANLAYMYLNGLGVAINKLKALEYAQRASEKGSGWASAILGRMYRDGSGAERDIGKAIQLFGLSSSRGNIEGMVDLAELRLRDKPRYESTEDIKSLLERAAEIDDFTLLGQQAKNKAMKLMVEVERLKLSIQPQNQQAQLIQQQLHVVFKNESRVALIIGNATYKVNPLKNPVNDSNDMARSLKSIGFDVIEVNNASLLQMREATRRFADKLSNSDVGLVYYSGHGVEVRGKNYLIPVNADIKREYEVVDQAFDASQFLEMMDNIRGPNNKRVNILIVDACRNNELQRSWRSTNNGLARMDAPGGTFISFATAPGRVASDGVGRNSPYTKHLLQALKQPNMPIEQVFKVVRRNVMDETKGEQIPWENSSLVGDFFFTVQR